MIPNKHQNNRYKKTVCTSINLLGLDTAKVHFFGTENGENLTTIKRNSFLKNALHLWMRSCNSAINLAKPKNTRVSCNGLPNIWIFFLLLNILMRLCES